MPAPTALLRQPEELAEISVQPRPQDDDEVLLDVSDDLPREPLVANAAISEASSSSNKLTTSENDITMDDGEQISRPKFAPAKDAGEAVQIETRKVSISPHRMSPLKANWSKIYPPLVEHLKLQVRMNLNKKAVELRTSKHTDDTSAIQKGADFLTAFNLGFDLDDAIALLRIDELYIESFEIKDVKTLQNEHLGRAIGRIAGKDGKTKYAIENASRTRIVLADTKIHILGSFKNIHIAREAVVSLILGSPPGKVYGNLRTVASRMKERF